MIAQSAKKILNGQTNYELSEITERTPTDEPISRQDAEEALDFLQAILELLYYMRPKFQHMKARRASAKP